MNNGYKPAARYEVTLFGLSPIKPSHKSCKHIDEFKESGMHADDRLPRYQRLRDELVALIAARHWRPGEAIPTEQALAKRYEVAVGTVRKAVDLLVAEGLLE